MSKHNAQNRKSYTKDKEKIQSNQKPKKSMLREIVETILMAVVLYVAIDFCIGRFRVENISMETTFTEGELVMVNKLNYKFSEPQRGDVVIFHSPVDEGKDYIKRMIGLPGDHIRVHDGTLFINGEKIEEPWLHETIEYNGDWDVGENEYFVLGDNRNHSSDSHVWGGVPRKNLIGNAFFVYWPLNHIRVVHDKIELSSDAAADAAANVTQ